MVHTEDPTDRAAEAKAHIRLVLADYAAGRDAPESDEPLTESELIRQRALDRARTTTRGAAA